MGLDRSKKVSDVMERVLDGPSAADERPVHTEVIALAVRPWLGGTTTLAAQVTVGGVRPDTHPSASTPDSAAPKPPRRSGR